MNSNRANTEANERLNVKIGLLGMSNPFSVSIDRDLTKEEKKAQLEEEAGLVYEVRLAIQDSRINILKD